MIIQSRKGIVITDRLLRSWVRCKRKAWLDKYGDKKKRLWTSHKALQIDHQHRSFVELISQKPGKKIGTCQEGASFVFGLRLQGKTPLGQSIKANLPLLKKIHGTSQWGKFAYQPVIARIGNNVTREHRLALSLAVLLLNNFQKSQVNKAIAISKNGNKFDIENLNLSINLRNKLLESIIKLDNDLKLLEPPPLIKNRKKCSICSWKNLCNDEASSQGHLSEVSGIGAKRMDMLQNLGINNLKDLAIADPIKLANNLGKIHGNIAQTIVKQAFVQKEKRKERINNLPPLPELESSNGILLYDIESDPDNKHDFLHGFIKLNKNKSAEWKLQNASYQPILILDRKNEQLAWKRLKRKLNNYPNWPILHYGETELISIYRLAQRNNAKDKDLKLINSRCIDIHSRLRKHWLLPINNYGLKTVANYIGFNWLKEGTNGPMALLWWRQWKNSRRSKKDYSKNLQYIFNYNRDDCLATWAIAYWLLNEK